MARKANGFISVKTLFRVGILLGILDMASPQGLLGEVTGLLTGLGTVVTALLDALTKSWTDTKYQTVIFSPKNSEYMKSLGNSDQSGVAAATVEKFLNKRILFATPTTTTTATTTAGYVVPPPIIRKDIRLMTKQEYQDFAAAVQQLFVNKADPNSDMTVFDMFAGYHRSANSPGAHQGAGFIAWHTKFMRAFDAALKSVNPSVNLPFIDFRPNTQIPNHCDACIFSSDFVGNNDGVVRIGPFKNKNVTFSDCAQAAGQFLNRTCGYSNDYLINYDEYNYVLNKYKTYADFVRPFQTEFEDSHGLIHVANGGHLNSLTCAATDPFFYMLHGFIHSTFERTMDLRYSYQDRVNLAYPTGDIFNPIPPPHQGSSPATPFDTLLKDCLTESMKSNMNYVMVPDSCTTDQQCNPTGSDLNAYWCKITSAGGRCATKIRIGGACWDQSFGTYPDKACYQQSVCAGTPYCTSNVCQCIRGDGSVANKINVD